MAQPSDEKKDLFRRVRHQLGAPLRKIEITDEMFCSLLEIAVEDTAEQVQAFLIEHQWHSILGQNVNNIDIAFALTTRSLDFETQFTYAYSKQVGLQARGPWELKKDFVEIESGKQVYEIPAGREINEVLWITPTATHQALFANFGGIDFGFGGGFAQLGAGHGGQLGSSGLYGGYGGYYIAPAYDVLLTASDINLKHRILRSELVYKITAGPNGTRLLHLLSTPGSKFSFGHSGAINNGLFSSLGLVGSKVWYHYYDTSAENIDKCRKENKDIIKIPSEVPLNKLDFEDFNEPFKIHIRQYLTSIAKETLGRVRGKFGGKVGVEGAEATMDYEALLQEGKEEKIRLIEKLQEWLLRLNSETQLERKANESENLNKSLKYRPLGFYLY